MDDTQVVLRELFSNPVALLYVALVILAVFLGLLIFDAFKGRKRPRHGRRFRHRRETLGYKLRKPFRQAREVAKLVRALILKRARRRERTERLAEQMRRYSK